MDKKENGEEAVPESPKPLAFTIEFDGGKGVDQQRHKALVEKFQNRHRRGQSLTKIDDPSISASGKKHPSTGNLPRKNSFQSEGGYYSSDEKSNSKNVRQAASSVRLKSEFTLPLKDTTSDRMMTQSFPNGSFLDVISSPDIELQDISSPELDSPFSPKLLTPSPLPSRKKLPNEVSTPSVNGENEKEAEKEDAVIDLDKSDSVSDAGTYTLEADNYTEEQKARMSIDREFNIEQVRAICFYYTASQTIKRW